MKWKLLALAALAAFVLFVDYAEARRMRCGCSMGGGSSSRSYGYSRGNYETQWTLNAPPKIVWKESGGTELTRKLEAWGKTPSPQPKRAAAKPAPRKPKPAAKSPTILLPVGGDLSLPADSPDAEAVLKGEAKQQPIEPIAPAGPEAEDAEQFNKQ